MIKGILAKQAKSADIELLGVGNAGNHIHLRIKFSHKKKYFKFIRAVAGEIALKIKKIANPDAVMNCNFWNQRPFTTIVAGARYVDRLVDYLQINELEGRGYIRSYARLRVEQLKVDRGRLA